MKLVSTLILDHHLPETLDNTLLLLVCRTLLEQTSRPEHLPLEEVQPLITIINVETHYGE